MAHQTPEKTASPWKAIFGLLTTVLIGVGLALSAHWLLGEEYSSRQRAKVLAPVAGYYYGTSHRDEITVLLIDDASLSNAGITWPAPYSYEARLLRAIGQYKPKAVFLDILFKNNRKDADITQLVSAICTLKEKGINVYLGATENGAGQFALRPELEKAAGNCFKKVAVYFSPDEIDRSAWSYPVSGYENDGEKSGLVNPAAVEIYNDLRNTYLIPKSAESSLALTWGIRPAKHGIPWTGQEHGKRSSELYCREDQGKHELLPGGLRSFGLKHHEKPICVFHETLLAQDLAPNSAEAEDQLKSQLSGKTVMVGVSFAESHDHVLTPLHGRIPGVYLHAMALDNLLKYGANYPEEINFHFKNDAPHRKLFWFLVVAIILTTLFKMVCEKLRERFNDWLDIRAKAHEPKKHKTQSRFVRWPFLLAYAAVKIAEKLVFAFVVLLFTAIVVGLGAYVFNIGFISTFSVALFVVAAEWLEIREKVAHHLSPPKRRAGDLKST